MTVNRLLLTRIACDGSCPGGTGLTSVLVEQAVNSIKPKAALKRAVNLSAECVPMTTLILAKEWLHTQAVGAFDHDLGTHRMGVFHSPSPGTRLLAAIEQPDVPLSF